jgi:hypothetical protein
MTDETVAGNDSATAQRHLRELIEALDRRVPHIERLGEIDIVDAATALREKATQRLAALESESGNRG